MHCRDKGRDQQSSSGSVDIHTLAANSRSGPYRPERPALPENNSYNIHTRR